MGKGYETDDDETDDDGIDDDATDDDDGTRYDGTDDEATDDDAMLAGEEDTWTDLGDYEYGAYDDYGSCASGNGAEMVHGEQQQQWQDPICEYGEGDYVTGDERGYDDYE